MCNKSCTLWVYQTDLWIVLCLAFTGSIQKTLFRFLSTISGCPAIIFYPRNVSTSTQRLLPRHSRTIETTKLFVQQVTILGFFLAVRLLVRTVLSQMDLSLPFTECPYLENCHTWLCTHIKAEWGFFSEFLFVQTISFSCHTFDG